MKYEVDTAYFSRPLNLESAYWLGFLFADGCVFTRRNGREWLLQLKLQRGDEEQVRAFRTAVSYSGDIKYPTEDSAAVCIYSKALCATLLELGLRPRKSYGGSLIPDDLLHGNLRLALLQGYFDGNGCASTDANGLKVSVSGPDDLVDWFRAQVATHVSAASLGSRGHRGEHCIEASWHGNRQGPEILTWIFQEIGTPRLRRRVDKAKALLEVYYC